MKEIINRKSSIPIINIKKQPTVLIKCEKIK